jgi:hypothetical protein
MNFKITDLQIFNMADDESAEDNFSANIAVNDAFMIQLGTDGEYSIPSSNLAAWLENDVQDQAAEDYEIDDLVEALGLPASPTISELIRACGIAPDPHVNTGIERIINKMENLVNFDERTALIKDDALCPHQQKIWLIIDFGNRTIDTDTDYKDSSYTNFYEAYGHAHRFPLPLNVDAVELRSWIDEDILPLAQKVADGYESVWDGSNQIAEFSDEAAEALEQIEAEIESWDDATGPVLPEGGGMWEVGEWLETYSPNWDLDIDQLASEIMDSAEYENVVLWGGRESVVEWLEEKKEEDEED